MSTLRLRERPPEETHVFHIDRRDGWTIAIAMGIVALVIFMAFIDPPRNPDPFEKIVTRFWFILLIVPGTISMICYPLFSEYFGCRVTLDGINAPTSCYPLVGHRQTMNWSQIRSIKTYRMLIQFMVLSDGTETVHTFIPIGLYRKHDFFLVVQRLAPPDHPLQHFLKTNAKLFTNE